MKAPETYQHLSDHARPLLEASDEIRIRAIKQGSWISYSEADEVLAKMEELLDYPRITRMPNMLLVSPSFNGKTSLLEHFVKEHPPIQDPELEVTISPVVMVDAPETPSLSGFYSGILDKLLAPYAPGSSAFEKKSQVKKLFRDLDVRLLIIDEINNIIAGGTHRQQELRNAIKSLSNETKVPIVLSGTEDAYNGINTDPQMTSRFPPYELPLWVANPSTAKLVKKLERRTPLRRPSNLADPIMLKTLCDRSEGTLGDLCDLFKALAIDAIRTCTECITIERINELKWVAPSRRKRRRRG